MGKYEENSPEVLKAMQIAEKQFSMAMSDESDEIKIYFMHDNISICNPFTDKSGRLKLSLEQAYATYGDSQVDYFIEKCNIEPKVLYSVKGYSFNLKKDIERRCYGQEIFLNYGKDAKLNGACVCVRNVYPDIAKFNPGEYKITQI